MVGSGTGYLTRFDGRLEPASITDDIHFAPAASDQTMPAGPFVGGGARKSDSNSAGVFVGVGVAIVLLSLISWLGFRRRPPRSGS